ncbi:MAG: hypothetical protein QOE86_651 [Solirubrobacteraceae bacterium]|nr:hypothetical protein [Solirubrobacteraceae bacterium]
MTRRLVIALLAGAAALPAASALAADAPSGRVGPSLRITGNGRLLKPMGALSGVGNFPTGGALTPDGRFLWVVDSGHGIDDVQRVDVATGAVVQVLPMPGAYGGIAISPDGTRAWVSGTPAGSNVSGPVKGAEGDVLHVFAIDPASGNATEQDPITLPASTGGAGQAQSLPPTSKLYPAGVAVSRDGHYVGVALQQADKVAILDTKTHAVATTGVGRYPTDVVFDPRGRLFVANLYDGSLSVVDPASHAVTATVAGLGGARGDRNAQPEGLAIDPDGKRLYAAVAQRDLLATVDLDKLKVTHTVDVGRKGGPLGVVPADVAVDGDNVYVANANEDTVAVIARRDRPAKAGLADHRRRVYLPPSLSRLRRQAAHPHRKPPRTRQRTACGGPTKRQARRYRQAIIRAYRHHDPAAARRARHRLPKVRGCAAPEGYGAGIEDGELIGKLPTAAYPDVLATTPDGKRLIWIAAKGFGAGPNPLYSFDGHQVPGGNITTPVYGQYVLDALAGIVGRLPHPTDKAIRKATATADAQAVPINAQQPPAGTPVRPGGPIKHVFLIVRENRTYDQILGSDPRGDGDPSFELFDDNGVAGPTGGITPNAHALTRTFPLIDHFYSNSEVSVDGHLITTGGFANDYVQKALAQNYSRPGKSYDFGIAPITFGPNDFLFDQAVRQSVSFSNYGEQAAGILPFGADGRPTYGQVVANTNNVYPGPAQIGCLNPSGPGGNLATCFQDSGVVDGTGSPNAAVSRVNTFQAQFDQQVASGSVPAFSYLVVPNDHTNGTTPGAYTPQANIADNDLALGQIVDVISHSSVWDSSAIFVEEDDSQDGADHVDAHRQPGLVISPYARRGAVVHTRFDQYSVMATVERILGLKPLSINDALAVPMYDAFVSGGVGPDVEGTRYKAIQPDQPLNAVNPSSGRMAALSAAMPFDRLDLVPQAVSDAILYAAVHGSLDGFPGPGPNASEAEHARATGALKAVARSDSARAWLERHGGDGDDAPAAGARSARAATAKPAPLTDAVKTRAAEQAKRALAAMR